MNSRRSHLQRTAKDAVYASELAAKESGRAKRKAGTDGFGRYNRDSRVSGEVFESPKKKRKYLRTEQKPRSPANAIEKVQVSCIHSSNNGAAPYNREEAGIQNYAYHSYFMPESNDFHATSTVLSREKHEEEKNITSYPKLDLLRNRAKPNSAESHHNGIVSVYDNFNVSCEKKYQYKNEADIAFCNTGKSTTNIFTPVSESMVHVNQCDRDQEQNEVEHNRASERGRLQIDTVKPRSFEVLGEFQSTSALNTAEDILSTEKKCTTHHQSLTPIFMTQLLNFEYGFDFDDSNDVGSTGKQYPYASPTTQPNGKNCCKASNHFLHNSNHESPDEHEHKPCSNRILSKVSTLQMPKSTPSPTKAFSSTLSSIRSVESQYISNPQQSSENLNPSIFSANIGNTSNASHVSCSNDGRNGIVVQNSPVLHEQSHIGLTAGCLLENPLEMSSSLCAQTVIGELPSQRGATNASCRQSSYSAIESGSGVFPGIPPRFATARKCLAARVPAHYMKCAQNILNDTDSKEDNRNSNKAKIVQQVPPNDLSTTTSPDAPSIGLVGLSDEQERIAGLQISDIVRCGSPQISRDLKITHDSKVFPSKNGSGHDFSATDDSVFFSSFPMFTTAGKRNAIQVSEKSLIEAGNFLNGSSSKSHGSCPLILNSLHKDTICNQRIRSKLIRENFEESEHSYRKADPLIKELSSESGRIIRHKSSFPFTSEVFAHYRQPGASPFFAEGVSCGSETPTFTTAGKGHSIQVSEYSLIKANNLLSGLSSKRAVSNILPSATGASTAEHEESKEKNYLLCTDFGVSHAVNHDSAQAGTLISLSGYGKVGRCLPNFSTAGKGNVIQVSEHSLIEASKFLNSSASYGAPNPEEKINALNTPKLLGACESAAVAVSEDGKKKVDGLHGYTQTDASKELAIKKQPGIFTAFSTAGMGHVIQVSEQSLIEAGKFLNDSVLQMAASSSLCTPRCQSSLIGNAVAVTEDCKKTADLPFRDDIIGCDHPNREDFLRMDTSKESSSDVACVHQPGTSCALMDLNNLPTFSTAGTGQVIKVSEQSLVAARNFLNDSVRDDSTMAVTGDVRKNAYLLFRDSAVNTNPAIITDHSNLPSFSTAGMGHVIQVSEESLVAAQIFFTDSVPQRAVSSSNIGNHLQSVPINALYTPRYQRSGATVSVGEDCRRNFDSFLSTANPPTVRNGPNSDTLKERTSGTVFSVLSAKPGSSGSHASSTAGMGYTIQVKQQSLIEAGDFLNDAVPRSAGHSMTGKPLQNIMKNELYNPSFESVAAPATRDCQRKADQRLSDVKEDVSQLDTSYEHDSNTNLLSLPVFATAGKQNSIEADSFSLMLADPFRNESFYQDAPSDIFPNVNHWDFIGSRVPAHVLNKDVGINSGPLARLAKDEDHLQELFQEKSQPEKIASVTPGAYKVKHSLGTFSGKAVSPRSLSKAAGILGHSPTPISSITSVPQVLDDKLKLKSSEIPRSKLLLDLPVNVSKLSLRDLDVIQGNIVFSSVDSLLELGINRVLINLSSNNASLLVFSDDDTPSYFYKPLQKGQVAYWQSAFEGSSAKEMYLDLIRQGFSEDLITKRWVANHYRWIVWSSAAMERRFPRLLCGRFCTKIKVMDKLKKRCRRELLNGYRPALRKILNRDAAASSLMILCVCNIFVDEKNDVSVKLGNETDVIPSRQQVESSSVKAELTDGWYSILALFDSNLSKLATSGQISVGSKLAISGAVLVGAEDGIDPLESGYNTQSPLCHVSLRLFSNSTRRAKWNAKLGFCNYPLGAIPTTAFSNIHPDGGPVSLVELVLCKVYPILYYENESKRILTESQESIAKLKFERDYEVAMEGILEDMENEPTLINDKYAPEVWDSMLNIDDPCFYSSSPSEAGRQITDLWMNQGKDQYPGFRQKSINDVSVDVAIRKSTPFIRAIVKILRRNQVEAADYSSNSNSSALLTLWEPSDDWISLLKEGTAVRLRNVKCKPSQIDGRTQLSANQNTSIELLPKPSDSILRFSGFEERFYCTMVSLHLLSKLQRFQHEFDVVGFRILTSSETHPTLLRSTYVTDESGLLLRIDRYFDSERRSSPPWTMSKYGAESSSVYSFQNLRLIDFCLDRNCAIALWTESSVVKTSPNSRSLELLKFLQTSEGENFKNRVSNSLSKNVVAIGKGPEELYVAIGIVLSVHKMYYDETQCNASQQVNIVIDCGNNALLKASICLKCLEQATGLLFEDATIVLCSNKLRNTGKYFSFVLKQVYSQGCSTEMNVEAMSKVDASLLCSSYRL